ncbi:MAG: hypothetical protein VX498_07660 [Myxococcota bacterium]|nr:hypothetical protein [Myxococcota bacterium]
MHLIRHSHLILFALSPVLLLLYGCSDNGLRPIPGDVPILTGGEGDDDDSPIDPGVDDDDTGGPYDDGVDDDDVGLDEPPPWRDDCPPEATTATDFYGPNGEDEIYVLDSGATEATATLVVPVAGLYAVYDTAVYESGASQTNETGYLRIRNSHNPEGTPAIANCGDEYIVADNDNSGSPPAALIYLGTFDLDEGENNLTLHHFCPLFDQGQCEAFHNGAPDDASGCYGNGPNSIHLVGDAICLVPR